MSIRSSKVVTRGYNVWGREKGKHLPECGLSTQEFEEDDIVSPMRVRDTEGLAPVQLRPPWARDTV